MTGDDQLVENAPGSSISTAIQVAPNGPTLPAAFEDTVAMYGDRPALWVDGRLVTYRELAAIAASIARPMRHVLPQQASARCAILCGRGLSAFAAVLGALSARCVYVPLNPSHPVERLVGIILQSEADFLVVDARSAALAREVLREIARPMVVVLPECETVPDWAVGLPEHRFFCQGDLGGSAPYIMDTVSPDDGAYLMFTSGSTGLPKGVLVRHRNVIAYLRNTIARYRPTPDDRFSQVFDLTFDLSVHDMFLCWASGATLYCLPQAARFAPREFIRRHELTMWFSVPSTAAVMMRLGMLRPGDFPTLRYSLFCGEALPRRLARAWVEAAPNSVVENLYGPTEATIAITAYRLPPDTASGQHLPDILPIGEALQGQTTAIIDTAGGIVPDGESGELCLGGTQVTDGYWRRPDLTAERFVRLKDAPAETTWYRTGDRVRRTTLGLEFLGRLDRQVKIGGYRVELQEVETALARATGAVTVAAIAWPLDETGLARGIVGFVSRTDRLPEDIHERCRAILPPYARPSAIHQLDHFPLNSSGKIDYAQLREMLR